MRCARAARFESREVALKPDGESPEAPTGSESQLCATGVAGLTGFVARRRGEKEPFWYLPLQLYRRRCH